MRKKLKVFPFDKKQLERLAMLSAKTKVPKAVYIRESLDIVLNKYKKQLIDKSQKRERPSQVDKLKGLNKETLERLYVKEGKSIYIIAKMFGCTSMTVWTRCKKYGIKTRPKGKRIVKIKKSVLQRLYVREGKSIDEIARMFSVHPYTVRMKCNQYGIEIKDHRIIEGLTKSLLQKMYVEEGKSTREIAKTIGCSREPVRLKCKQFGIPLRPFTKKSIEIDKPTLYRLYIEEKKTVTEVASIFNCSIPTILRKARKYDIKLRPRGGKKLDIDESTLRRLYVEEGKSMPEVAKIFDCSVSVISQRIKEFGSKKKNLSKL